MTCQELQPLLSEFIDDALESERAIEVRGHLTGCAGCGKELELLRSVCGLVRGLKARPLPDGFLARLALKRAQPASLTSVAADYAPRVLGYAFAAVLVGVVVLRNNRPASWPARAVSEDPLAEVAQAPSKRTRPAPFRDTGGPVSKSAGPMEAPLLPEPADSRLSAPGRASLNSEGSPAFTPASSREFDNAAQADHMKKESSDLGIQSVNPEQERPQAEPFLGRQLGTPDVARHAEVNVQQLIAMRHAIEDASGKPKPVTIKGQTAPVLYDTEKDQGNGQSLDEAATVGSWQGDYSGGNEGTRTIGDAASWRKLWGTLPATAKVPAVDFSRQEVVAIFLDQRPSGGFAVEILSVAADESAVTVRWRERQPGPSVPQAEGVTTPYALRVTSKSDLPVRFEKVP